ncbi:MAG: RNA-binding S4 domain-containing protein [Deltaproteobacteria bacterium]
MDSVRIDKWLWAARFFKTRTLAQQACTGGHMKVGGRNAKPAHPLRVGERIVGRAPRGDIIVIVTALAEKRGSAKLAAELFEDHSPPPPPRRDPGPVERIQGLGRPTKGDRRALRRLRGR